MFSLRRLALRAVPLPSTPTTARSRPITNLTSSILRPVNSHVAFVKFQKRFASEEATQAEPEARTEESKDDIESRPVKSAYDSLVDRVSETTSQVAQSISNSAESVRDSVGQGYGERETSSTAFKKSAPPSRRLFIGNIFFETMEEDIKREFSKSGAVERVKIIRDTRGLSKGFGYVDFVEQESAKRAIANMNGQTLDGRRISVQYSDRGDQPELGRKLEQGKNQESSTLFIGNLAFDMTDRDLNNLFQNIKDVTDVRVAIDRRTGQPRGFAHADFVDTKSAVEAFNQLNNKEVCGRILRIDYSKPNQGGSPLANRQV